MKKYNFSVNLFDLLLPFNENIAIFSKVFERVEAFFARTLTNYWNFKKDGFMYCWGRRAPEAAELIINGGANQMKQGIFRKFIEFAWQPGSVASSRTPLRSLGFNSVRGPCRTKSFETNFSRYLKRRTSKTLWRCVRDHRTEKWKFFFIFHKYKFVKIFNFQKRI